MRSGKISWSSNTFLFEADHHNLGEPVTRQFPVVLTGEQQAPITTGSGRLELARWLVSPDHPLTSRVMANRIWYWHFGEGLVRTANNFGLTGGEARPSGPTGFSRA